MPPSAPIAILGAGPSGSHLAARLAAAGRAVLLLDEKPAWEKPCGGGVTDKALRAFPFLRDAVYARNFVSQCELTSPAGRRLSFTLDHPVAIFSRQTLNQLLLDRAIAAGAQFVPDRAVALLPRSSSWSIELKAAPPLSASSLVIATGARNPFRAQFPTSLRSHDWMATAGYYIAADRLPWPRECMVLRFLPGLEGYIWSFPRTDHASVGICGRIGAQPVSSLRQQLEDWLRQQRIDWRGSVFFSHLLPAPSLAALRQARLEAPPSPRGADSPPWAIIGDAAGLADPITGEGLFYALRSAELLARSLLASPAPAAYSAAMRREVLPELEAAAAIADRFYRGDFLGRAVLERMAQFGAGSAVFRQLLSDLFSGAQGYIGLRRRLYRNLVPTLWQLARSHR